MRTEPGRLAPRSPARFLPPLLWMGLIALGSSSLLSGDRTDRWMLTLLGPLAPWASPATLHTAHLGLRKLGHLVEYGVLAVLWHRALAPSPHATTSAFVLAAAYGGLDELWQGLHPSRTPAVSDVAVDAGGALLALAAWEWPGSLTAATLGVAAWGLGLVAGLGLLMIALDLALGRPAADLGLATLGLGLTAAGLGSLARLARRARLRVSSGPRAPAPP
jgi:VanZ family protein